MLWAQNKFYKAIIDPICRLMWIFDCIEYHLGWHRRHPASFSHGYPKILNCRGNITLFYGIMEMLTPTNSPVHAACTDLIWKDLQNYSLSLCWTLASRQICNVNLCTLWGQEGFNTSRALVHLVKLGSKLTFLLLFCRFALGRDSWRSIDGVRRKNIVPGVGHAFPTVIIRVGVMPRALMQGSTRCMPGRSRWMPMPAPRAGCRAAHAGPRELDADGGPSALHAGPRELDA